MLRAPGAAAAAAAVRPAKAVVRRAVAVVGQAAPTRKAVTFTDYASSARQDVASLLEQLEGSAASSSWVSRLRAVSSLALDLWAPEAPHWRVAGPLVVPPAHGSSTRHVQELATALSVDERNGREGLDPLGRASCLRAVCAFRGGSSTTQRVSSLMSVLVDGGGVQNNKGKAKRSNLAEQLPLQELLPCIKAISSAMPLHDGEKLKDSPVRDFVVKGTNLLLQSKNKLKLRQLLDLNSALGACGLAKTDVEDELRKRLGQAATHASAISEQGLWELVACATALREVGILRSKPLRLAMLPNVLPPGTAADLLQHTVPHDGSMSSAEEFIVAMAVSSFCKGCRALTPRELAAAIRGILALQARGDGFAIEQAARALRGLWSRVALQLPLFAPRELSDALRAYWWQLLYSRQELEWRGSSTTHPTVEFSSDGNSRGGARDKQEKHALEELRQKLLRPVMDSLGQMPLRQVAACLTALAPPVRPPDVLTASDRAALNASVQTAFSAGSGAEAALRPVVSENGDEWWEDFWAGEVSSLSTVELLELACGLREAELRAGWPIAALLSELEDRLQPARVRKLDQPVELSHFLLLRLCRVVDLWHGHQVEAILKNLLLDPQAIKPLPTSYFVAMLTALCEFPVPKEMLLRLTVAFIDRAEVGEREVLPEQWADILRAMRPLDEVPSWERMTPRLVQRLVPHLGGLQASSLASLLAALADRPIASKGEPHSPIEQLPAAACQAVRQAVKAGAWEFEQVVGIFESLGRLGWYDEQAVAAIIGQCANAPLLEPHAPLLLPLVRACASLRIHHAPLLQKVVLWYCWCYNYLWTKPLASQELDELLELADHLSDLSFQSLELHGVLAGNLTNPNASPRQLLGLLSALARFSHFPPEFKDTCARVCSESTDNELSSLSHKDLINAFNIHLCAVFDGPAALKHWLTTDENMKSFFQVHTSQKWYQKQDQERVSFLQSPAYSNLKHAVKTAGLDLVESEAGEVYHVEFVSKDAKDRLSSADPPTALVCIKSKEQLRWYVPIMAEGAIEQGGEVQNRCHHFRYMFRESVQKLRHLQAMGYRTAVIWMSEWNSLQSKEERLACLQAATGLQGRRNAAFRPSSAEEEDAYR